MNAQEIRRALGALEEERVPAGLDLWPRLRARLAAHPRRRGHWLPATRLGWAALALVALLAVSATVYATPSVTSRLFRVFEPEVAKQGDLASPGQQLGLSRTIDNVTVTVEWAQADTQHIRIGYIVRSSDGRRFDPCGVMLADGASAPLPFTMGYGVTGESELVGVALPPGEGSYVWVFANQAQGPAVGEALALRLEIQVEELILPTSAPAAVEEPTGPAGPQSQSVEPLPMGERLGPFIFEFSIPVTGNAR